MPIFVKILSGDEAFKTIQAMPAYGNRRVVPSLDDDDLRNSFSFIMIFHLRGRKTPLKRSKLKQNDKTPFSHQEV